MLMIFVFVKGFCSVVCNNVLEIVNIVLIINVINICGNCKLMIEFIVLLLLVVNFVIRLLNDNLIVLVINEI